jgi:hypothetical protein
VEDKWPNIPCGAARISSGTASTRKTGPLLGHEGMGLPSNNVTSIDASNCRMGHDLVITSLGNLVIEADAIVVDPYYVSAIGSQHKGCYAQSHYSDLREDFPDMNQITRKGSGWRDYVESGDLTTMAFSVGSADCRAIEKTRTDLARRSRLRDPRQRLPQGQARARAEGYRSCPRLSAGATIRSRGNLRAPPQ